MPQCQTDIKIPSSGLLRIEIHNLRESLWSLSVQSEGVYSQKTKVNLSLRILPYYEKSKTVKTAFNPLSTMVYHIDGAADVSRFAENVVDSPNTSKSSNFQNTEPPCDRLSFMQGSVIGILVVFIVLCVAIIIILLRRKSKSEEIKTADDLDQPPQYSKQDHNLFQVKY